MTSWFLDLIKDQFLSDQGIPGVRSMGPSLSNSLRDLTDVTLADEDTNAILTDNVNRAFQVIVAT